MTADEQGHVPNEPVDPGQQADELLHGDDTNADDTDVMLRAQVMVLDDHEEA